MVVGYCRVSSVGQSLKVQLDKLKKAGCEEIYQEKKSGTVDSNRPELKTCLQYVRKGDTLVITKLDRLARSTLDLHNIVDRLRKKGVNFKVLDQSIDTGSAEGKLLFSVMSAFAEFENSIRRERQMDGIERAKSRGIRFGRQPKLTDEQIAEMRKKRKEGVLIRELMVEFNLSKASIYRLLSSNT